MKLPMFLRVLLTPSCWSQNYRYSKAWDARLNQLLRDHKFTNIEQHTAMIGGINLWIENYPYAAFHPYDHRGETIRVRAKRSTILRAGDKLSADLIFQISTKSGQV